MIFHCTSELILATLIQRYEFDPVPKKRDQLKFTGCQVLHFIIVLIQYINFLNLFLYKMSIFEEYGAFKMYSEYLG